MVTSLPTLLFSFFASTFKVNPTFAVTQDLATMFCASILIKKAHENHSLPFPLERADFILKLGGKEGITENHGEVVNGGESLWT